MWLLASFLQEYVTELIVVTALIVTRKSLRPNSLKVLLSVKKCLLSRRIVLWNVIQLERNHA